MSGRTGGIEESLIYADISETSGFCFKPERTGPSNFSKLINADYGDGFRMPTLPEVSYLLEAAIGKQYREDVKRTLSGQRILGNTAVMYNKKGFFVQDEPLIEDGEIIIDVNDIIQRFEKGDPKARFTHHDQSIIESQNPLDLQKNHYLIALFGGEEAAERIAKVSVLYRFNPFFNTLDVNKLDSPKIIIPEIFSGPLMNRLCINATQSDFYDGYSFGVANTDIKKVENRKERTIHGRKGIIISQN